MNRSLLRLLRIREMVEDQARLELERTHAELRSLEQSAEQQRQMTRRIRTEVVEDITAQETTAEGLRLKMIDAELAGRCEARLKGLAEAAKPFVDQAREQFMERRRERRQAEILHSNALREEERHQIRQDQNRTDDLMQSRSHDSGRRG